MRSWVIVVLVAALVIEVWAAFRINHDVPFEIEPSARSSALARLEQGDLTIGDQLAARARALEEARSAQVPMPDLGIRMVRGVVTKGGRPAPGVAVSLDLRPLADGVNLDGYPPLPWPITPWRAQTDDRGYFEFKHLPKSDFIVRAWSAQQLAITAVLFDETHLVWDSVLELRPAQVLGGAIVDAEGAPIADAMVFPCPVDTTSASWLSFLPETTDATGRFLFTHVPDTCKFIVNAPGYGAWVSQAIHAGTTNAVISVEPSGGVAGVLSHVQEDRPAANLPVRLEAVTYPLMTRRTKTDINGEFTFANLPAGVYRVALDTDRFAFASGSPCIEMRAGAGGVARQTLEVMRAEFARGRVTDETGAGVPNVTVMARTAASSIQAKTDYAGYYQLRGLVPGQYRVAVRDAAGFAIEAVPAPVLAVQPDRDAVGPNFVLRPGAGKGRVTFHAVAADRRPLEGAAVFYVVEPVEGEDGADVLRGAALTDASGQFTLEEVPRDWRFRAYASTGVQVSALTDWASLDGRREATVALVVSTKAAERLPEILAALHP